LKHLQKRSFSNSLARGQIGDRQTTVRCGGNKIGGHSWRETALGLRWTERDGVVSLSSFTTRYAAVLVALNLRTNTKSYHQLNANNTLLNHGPYNHLLHRRMFLLPPSQSSPHRPRHPLHRHKHQSLPPEEG
jgi:hypothetical protein